MRGGFRWREILLFNPHIYNNIYMGREGEEGGK